MRERERERSDAMNSEKRIDFQKFEYKLPVRQFQVEYVCFSRYYRNLFNFD